jgi:MOSC domain-containing protein YiiM
VTGRIVQVSVSAGGVPKTAVESANVTPHGLEGDRHRDLEHHGGPDRAVCIFAGEAIEALKAEGHPIVPGGLGENLTVAGLDWSTVVPEAMLKIGDDLVVQITRYTSPCVNITRSFLHGDYSRVSQKRHPGWSRVYARVLVPGSVRPGDPARILSGAEARQMVGSLQR